MVPKCKIHGQRGQGEDRKKDHIHLTSPSSPSHLILLSKLPTGGLVVELRLLLLFMELYQLNRSSIELDLNVRVRRITLFLFHIVYFLFSRFNK